MLLKFQLKETCKGPRTLPVTLGHTGQKKEDLDGPGLSLDPQASQKSLCQKLSPQPGIYSQKVVGPLSGRSLGACPQHGSEM